MRELPFETYLVTQESLSDGRTTESIATAAIAGGIDAIQVREKDASAARQLQIARTLREPTAEAGVALLVNDRVDVALAAEADGVHLGDEDVPVAAAREQFPDGIIGRSVSTVEGAQTAAAEGADYLGVGAIYETGSKDVDEADHAIGLETVAAIADSVSIPIVGIGGVTPERTPEVVAAGADGVAVISAITQATDPEAATRTLADAVTEGKDRRGSDDSEVTDAPGTDGRQGSGVSVALGDHLQTVADASPLVTAITNAVTVNDVAQTILHVGGLPVMSDDRREIESMVEISDACLLNMGTVSETGEETMIAAGKTANESEIPVVVDPVGVGSTPTRQQVAERLVTELDVAVIKGNYGEIAALAGDDAAVKGVESVGEYDDIATSALACAQAYDTVVVASGETDVVATDRTVYEIAAGDPAMGTFVGTGCMLGGAIAAVTGGVADPAQAALTGTLGLGLAGEAAADGTFGEINGPGSFAVAFKDAIASLPLDEPADGRVEQVLSTDQ